MSWHETTQTPSRVSEVVFHRYGNQYFLSQVWMRGNPDYLSCPPSKAEREAKRSLRDNDRASMPTHSNVEVALMESPR